MKKGWKCICTIGGVAALCAGASFNAKSDETE